MVLSKRNAKNVDQTKYQLVPPDGGWGYLVFLATTIFSVTTIIPMASFGLVFGHFLSSVGNETTGTTLANSVFNTTMSFTGLVVNALLKKLSYRKVAIMGAVLYVMGATGTIFVTNLPQMLLCFGLLQGLGYGLMMPATFTAMTCYFEKKLNLMMSLSQTIIIATTMVIPPMAALSMERFGFRGTVALIAAIAGVNIPIMCVLAPIKKHLKMVKLPIDPEGQKELLNNQTKPLLEQNNVLLPKPRTSIVSLERAMSLCSVNPIENDEKSFWDSFSQFVDLSLLKDVRYVNISVGLALGYTSDVAFIAIIPLMLTNMGYSSTDIGLMLSVFFGSDLAARILLSVVSGIFRLNNRYLFLGGAFLSGVFKIAYVSGEGYWWVLVTLGAQGFLRCFIQTPLPLVISENYPDNFATAFSLNMVMNGFASLTCGPVLSIVKSTTGSDVMVCHVLSTAYLICVVTWSIELFIKRRSNART